jgi:uncharacterized repeat protein (TIGR02059 family)
VRYISNGTSFIDTGLTGGTEYFYRIFAKDTSGNYAATGVEVSETPLSTINWGRTTVGDTNTTSAHSRSMGGTSPSTDNMAIESISIYLGAQTGDVRLGVYTGGALDDPSTATLLWDAGTVNPSGTAGWYTINHPSGVAWPKDTVTWLAWKRDTGVAVYYSSSSAEAGDFQTARGRDNNSMSQTPTVAYPGTYNGTGSFSNYWYSIYVTYGLFDDVAPVLASSAVNGTSVVLTYTEANGLDTGSTPANGDFSIGTDGIAQTVTGVVVATNTVTLTLSPGVLCGDTITVSYTAGTNKIQDVAANAAADLTNEAVTNNTPDTPDLQQLHYRWRHDNGGEDQVGGYTANAVTFDGTNDWLDTSPSFADSKMVTGSFWVRRNGGNGVDQRIVRASYGRN